MIGGYFPFTLIWPSLVLILIFTVLAMIAWKCVIIEIKQTGGEKKVSTLTL